VKLSEEDEKALMEKFRHALIEARKSKNLSRNKLAWMSGGSVQRIDFIERGINTPSLHTLFKICHTLEIPLSSIIKEGEQALK